MEHLRLLVGNIKQNYEFSVRIEKQDRQYVAFESNCCKAGDYEYFQMLHTYIKDRDVVSQFHHFLMTRDVNDLVVKRDRPKTELYEQLRNKRYCSEPFLRQLMKKQKC